MNGAPHYLEIVTADVDAVCAFYSQTQGLTFDADPALGGARVAALPTGARIGVRGPLRPDEGPLWRVYLRVDDIAATTAAAAKAGAVVAVDGMDLGAKHGKISILLIGGVEHGLWQPPG